MAEEPSLIEAPGEVKQIETDLFEFRIGRIIARSFKILVRNFVPFAVLTGLLVGIEFGAETLITDATDFLIPDTIQRADDGTVPLGELGGTGAALAVILGIILLVISLLAISLLFYFLAQAVVIFGTFQDLRGRRASVLDCIKGGLKPVVPIVLIGVLSTIIISLGLILIIPGLIFAVGFYVAIPVGVVERPGVWASLARSRELVRGHGWRVFGLLIIATFITQFELAAGADGLFGLGDDVWQILGTVRDVLATAFAAIMSAVAYHDLRIIKDGANVDEIAAVFD